MSSMFWMGGGGEGEVSFLNATPWPHPGWGGGGDTEAGGFQHHSKSSHNFSKQRLEQGEGDTWETDE